MIQNNQKKTIILTNAHFIKNNGLSCNKKTQVKKQTQSVSNVKIMLY